MNVLADSALEQF